MLRWRLFSSALLISILLLLIWLDFNRNFGRPGVWLVPILLLFTGLAAHEIVTLLRAQKLQPAAWTIYVGTMAVVLAASGAVFWKDYPQDCPLGKLGWPISAFALAIGLVFIGEMRRFAKPGQAVMNIAISIFAIAYVGVLLSFLPALRMYHDNQWGMTALLSVIIIVKVSDSGAYAVGRTFGKHKMAPRLSPGKTIEGAIGGIITACATSWLVFQFLVPALVDEPGSTTPWLATVVYGLIVAIAGMLG